MGSPELQETRVVRVLVVEDSPLMLAATTRRIREQPDLELVGEAGDLDSARAAVEKYVPDVLLLDLRLGVSTEAGVELARDIGQRYPSVRTIIYSAYLSPQYESLLTEDWIWGYVRKTEPPGMTVEAIRAVGAGERYRREWR